VTVWCEGCMFLSRNVAKHQSQGSQSLFGRQVLPGFDFFVSGLAVHGVLKKLFKE